jgi:hypothetical protein
MRRPSLFSRRNNMDLKAFYTIKHTVKTDVMSPGEPKYFYPGDIIEADPNNPDIKSMLANGQAEQGKVEKQKKRRLGMHAIRKSNTPPGPRIGAKAAVDPGAAAAAEEVKTIARDALKPEGETPEEPPVGTPAEAPIEEPVEQEEEPAPRERAGKSTGSKKKKKSGSKKKR